MAVFSPTQDQGLASVKPGSIGRFSMCFPYFGFKHGNGLGSNHASVVPALRLLQKTLWLNWSLDGFLCSLVAASSSLERYVIWKPRMTYSNLSKQHQYLGALCVCVPWAMHCSSQGWGGCPSTSSVDSCWQFTWEFCPPLAVGQHSDTMGIACVAGTWMCIPEMVCKKNATGTWRSLRSKVVLSGLLPLLDFAMVCTVCT